MIRISVRWALAFVTTMASPLAYAQGVTTLAGYLSDHPWNARQSGPLLVLEPERVTTKGQADSLTHFDRKLVPVGRMSAIVPTEMVVTDDSFRQPPNLYDGLPRDAKVLYLLSTLTPGQWQSASGSGIGLNDLQGEQRAVFQSLIPRPFRWAGYLYGEPDRPATVTERGSLTDVQAGQVRLRVVRQLEFDVRLADKPEAYSAFQPFMVPGAPGTASLVWDDSQETDRPDAYGVVVRQSVRNALKPSQLAYGSDPLNVMLSAKPESTIRETLEAVGSATGLEIHADPSVARRSVRFVGQRARASDLLQALALAVTGTYRRVGPAFVLTSDLIGMGTRQLRFGIWQKELDAAVWKREDEWRRAIGKAGGLDYMHFASSDPLAPTRELLKKIDGADVSHQRGKLPANELTPAMRAFLDRAAADYSAQKFDLSAAGLHSQYVYGFVLPDGRPLEPRRSWLGVPSQFTPKDSQTSREPPYRPMNLPVEVAQDGPKHALVLGAHDADSARSAIRAARSHGFRELWLQTEDSGALKEAIAEGSAAGISVCLLLRPWQLPDSAPGKDPDVTLLGDTGVQLAEREKRSAAWRQYYERLAEQRYEPPPAIANVISPLDPETAVRSRSCVSLAGTPGLRGVCLLGTAPFGYEGARTDAHGDLDGSMIETQCFGYSTAMRLAFLRLKSIDPIDITWRDVYTGPDLSQPFFVDDKLRGSPSTYSGYTILKEWDSFRGEANRTAITRLLESLAELPGHLPILVEQRASLVNYASRSGELIPWKPPDPPPQMNSESPWMTPIVEGSVTRVALTADLPPLQKARVESASYRSWYVLPDRSRGPEVRVAFDATAIPADKLEAVLDSIFTRRE